LDKKLGGVAVAQKSNPKLIGAFVIGAVALLVVGVLVFGGEQYLKTKIRGVLYFEGSLAGLDIGSPLMSRGVKIGTVTGIVVRYDVEKQIVRIPVTPRSKKTGSTSSAERIPSTTLSCWSIAGFARSFRSSRLSPARQA
jgi:paraquat-inducible protein B